MTTQDTLWSTYDPNVMKKLEKLTGSIELTRDIMELIHLTFMETILEKGVVGIPGLGNIHLSLVPKDSPKARTKILRLSYSPKGSITNNLTLAGLGVPHSLSRILTKEVLDGLDKYNQKFLEDLPEDLVLLKLQVDLLKDKFKETAGLTKYDPSLIPIDVLLEVAKYAFENDLQEALQLLDYNIRGFYKRTALRWCYKNDDCLYRTRVRCDDFEDYKKFILTMHQEEMNSNLLRVAMQLNEEFSKKHNFKITKDANDKI